MCRHSSNLKPNLSRKSLMLDWLETMGRKQSASASIFTSNYEFFDGCMSCLRWQPTKWEYKCRFHPGGARWWRWLYGFELLILSSHLPWHEFMLFCVGFWRMMRLSQRWYRFGVSAACRLTRKLRKIVAVKGKLYPRMRAPKTLPPNQSVWTETGWILPTRASSTFHQQNIHMCQLQAHSAILLSLKIFFTTRRRVDATKDSSDIERHLRSL